MFRVRRLYSWFLKRWLCYTRIIFSDYNLQIVKQFHCLTPEDIQNEAWSWKKFLKMNYEKKKNMAELINEWTDNTVIITYLLYMMATFLGWSYFPVFTGLVPAMYLSFSVCPKKKKKKSLLWQNPAAEPDFRLDQ